MNESRKRSWLCALRKAACMTQTEAARAVGISLDHYQNIEYGKRNPSRRVANQLSELLEFPVDFFDADRVAFKHREVIVAQSE